MTAATTAPNPPKPGEYQKLSEACNRTTGASTRTSCNTTIAAGGAVPDLRSSRRCTWELSPPESGALAAPAPLAASEEWWVGREGDVGWWVGVWGVLLDDRQMPTSGTGWPQAVKRACPHPSPKVETAPADEENTPPNRPVLCGKKPEPIPVIPCVQYP